jgi:hypothetical protein
MEREYQRVHHEYEEGARYAKYPRPFRSRSTARASDDPASCPVPWGVSGTRLQTHSQWPARDPTWTRRAYSDDVITTLAARTGGGHTSLRMLVPSAEQHTDASFCLQRRVSSGFLFQGSFRRIHPIFSITPYSLNDGEGVHEAHISLYIFILKFSFHSNFNLLFTIGFSCTLSFLSFTTLNSIFERRKHDEQVILTGTGQSE